MNNDPYLGIALDYTIWAMAGGCVIAMWVMGIFSIVVALVAAAHFISKVFKC